MDNLACTHAGVWPVNQGACPICFNALREENARLKAKWAQVESCPLLGKLEAERASHRIEWDEVVRERNRLREDNTQLRAMLVRFGEWCRADLHAERCPQLSVRRHVVGVMDNRSETLAREWLETVELDDEADISRLAALLDRVREEERERIKGIVKNHMEPINPTSWADLTQAAILRWIEEGK